MNEMILNRYNEELKKLYPAEPPRSLLYGRTFDRFFSPNPFFGIVLGAYTPPAPEDDPRTLDEPRHTFGCPFLIEQFDEDGYEHDFEDYETSVDTCTCGYAERVAWRDVFRALDEVLDPGTKDWRSLFKAIDRRGI